MESNDELRSLQALLNTQSKELNDGPTAEDGEKQRATYYLSTRVLESFENTCDELRRNMPYKLKTKVKKSRMVEFALDLALDDYQRNGVNSALGRYVEQLKDGV